MLKRGIAIFLLVLGIFIIVISIAIYQDIRYKSGEITILQRYEPNNPNMEYELAYYGVVDGKFKGKNIPIIVDSYGSGAIGMEENSSFYVYLAKDKYKVRRIATPLGTLKKGDIIKIIYNGSMKE